MDVRSDLEFQVLSILRERFSYNRYGRLIREDLFESPQTRFIYRLICNYHDSHDVDSLPIRSLKLLLYSSVKDRAPYRGMIQKLKRNAVNDNSIKETLMKKFAKRQYLKSAIMEALDTLDKDEEFDLELVRQKVEEAILVDSKNSEESYDYFHDPYKRVHLEREEVRIKTGISEQLDRALNGGLAPGEIGIVIAPTGVGKTLALVNIGYGALIQGKKVVHATLEISPRKVARRYDVRICRAQWKEIQSDPALLKKRLGVFQRAGAGLQVKDYTSQLCSVMDLKAYLERLRNNKFRFDILIVDHADLMYSPKQYKERRYELSSIVAGLRRLAAQFQVPVWTASQATREAGKTGRTRLWDIAEDIGKANWADLAITISQTEEEKDQGMAWLKIAKTRLDKGNPRIAVAIDYDIMEMKGMKKEVQDVIKRELRG